MTIAEILNEVIAEKRVEALMDYIKQSGKLDTDLVSAGDQVEINRW